MVSETQRDRQDHLLKIIIVVNDFDKLLNTVTALSRLSNEILQF